MECHGKYSPKLSIGDRSTEEEIYVISRDRSLADMLQKALTCSAESVNNIAKGDFKAKVRHKYPPLFIGLGRMKAEYTITLSENSNAITVPRKVPLPLANETKEEIQYMVQQSVISAIDQPTDWCAPMVVTPKANGKLRGLISTEQFRLARKPLIAFGRAHTGEARRIKPLL